MIARNPEERHLYNMRLKMERDVRAKNQLAREEGLEEGRREGRQEGRQEGLQQGVLIGQVQLLQSLIGQKTVAADELAALPPEQLAELVKDLQQQLRGRG